MLNTMWGVLFSDSSNVEKKIKMYLLKSCICLLKLGTLKATDGRKNQGEGEVQHQIYWLLVLMSLFLGWVLQLVLEMCGMDQNLF